MVLSLQTVLAAAVRWLAAAVVLVSASAVGKDRHLLYVAVPGVFNHHPDANYNLRYGGVGIIVFDMDHDFKFVKRIPTWKLGPGQTVEMIKGIAADAASGRLYLTTTVRIAAFDLTTDKIVWEKQYEGGFDRLAISPDGRTLYVPTFEGAYWDVINAANGDLVTRLDTGTGAHNTIWAPDGSRVYLAGLHNNYLLVADPKTNLVIEKIGPFSSNIRPFTLDGANARVFVNTNAILGFEVGDVKTGKKLYDVAVQGFPTGKPARHNPCQSHGIAMTPEEKEIWLADGVNNYVHVFDATSTPPKQIADVKLTDSPGWVSLSIDAKYVFPSTGDIIDRKTRRIVSTLRDETATQVQSEKLLEIDFNGPKPVRNGNQFGVGQKR